MKKSKLNVQRYICILLCLILYITVLPLPISAEEAKSRTVRGEATATNTSRQWLRIPVGSMNMWREAGQN